MAATKDHADQLSFRDWLIHKLTESRWTSDKHTNVKALAKKLGVQADVLVAAIARREQALAARGLAPRAGRKAEHCRLAVAAPPEVHQYWMDFCAARQVAAAVFLRSLVHHFLLSGAPPEKPLLKKEWTFRGGSWPLPRLPANRRILHTRVTRGAQIAVDHYAEEWRVDASTILRGLVTGAIEGRVPRLQLVALSELWNDPARYLHPERFRT